MVLVLVLVVLVAVVATPGWDESRGHVFPLRKSNREALPPPPPPIAATFLK